MLYQVVQEHRNAFLAEVRARNDGAGLPSDPPAVLLRDRDDKCGRSFDHVAKGAGARVIKIAVRAPNMKAIAERFVVSARREFRTT